jgi:hypothetical protein
MSDFGFGCTCSRNSRSSNPASPRVGRVLLTESASPALDWWDYERNDEATLATVTVRATRTCHWVCPECGLRFEAKTNYMSTRPSCPDCAARRREKWIEEYARWKVTSVADVPELMAAWADDDDPREVMVGDAGPLRRFRCLKGHHPRIGPLSFLQSGCPHCRGAQTAQENKQWLADTLPEIASQWDPTRNGKLTPQNVVWDSKRTVWWRADCCGNHWQESVRDRDKYARTRCRPCRTMLGSLAWHGADISADVDGFTLVIEYDGAYWHAAPAKFLVDHCKTQDLLAAGFVVVRLREDNLPSLAIDHPRYRELRVYSAAPHPGAVMEEIRGWLASQPGR